MGRLNATDWELDSGEAGEVKRDLAVDDGSRCLTRHEIDTQEADAKRCKI